MTIDLIAVGAAVGVVSHLFDLGAAYGLYRRVAAGPLGRKTRIDIRCGDVSIRSGVDGD